MPRVCVTSGSAWTRAVVTRCWENPSRSIDRVQHMPLVAIVFGWPAATVSVLLGVGGVFGSRWLLVLTGLIVGAPFLFYLSLTPRFGWVSIVVAISYLAAVFATYQRRVWLAGVFFAPMILLVSYVALAVVNQLR